MKRNREMFPVIGLATSLALGVVACGGPTDKPAQTECVGLAFASPKGGPGAIQMRVFPKFNRNFGDARPMTVDGKVLAGNDAGASIQTPPQESSYGQFTFTWDTHAQDPQSSTVSASVTYEDKSYQCPTTKVVFDPTTYKITPHLPNSSY